jgi:anti-sigma regulatory factor (Ser/Thr protein kinase)
VRVAGSRLDMAESQELAGVDWFRFDAPIDGVPTRRWRQDLLPVLKSFGDEGAAEDVVIAAGELVANAIEHGGGVLALHVEGRPGDVRVEVYDHRPVLSGDGADDRDRGRGLAMVEAVCADWGWTPSADGKVVWARFTVGRRAG